MKCPHCLQGFHSHSIESRIGMVGLDDGEDILWNVVSESCPECDKPILMLLGTVMFDGGGTSNFHQSMIFPKGTSRSPTPTDVPHAIRIDYEEACLVLSDSPQASAALSRRCLQHLLAERNVSTKTNLGAAIDDALASGLPSYISDQLDSIRVTGNFAAHPQKSTNSGEILPVEDHEAEWNLDVLELLFDFYYVQPAKAAAKRDALNAKLKDAGKPDMKGSET